MNVNFMNFIGFWSALDMPHWCCSRKDPQGFNSMVKSPVGKKLLTSAGRHDLSCENSSDEESPPRKISKLDDGLFSFMALTKQKRRRGMCRGIMLKWKYQSTSLSYMRGNIRCITGRKRKIVFLFLQNFQRYTLMHLLLLNQWNDLLVLLDRSSDQIHVDADLINPHFKC